MNQANEKGMNMPHTRKTGVYGVQRRCSSPWEIAWIVNEKTPPQGRWSFGEFVHFEDNSAMRTEDAYAIDERQISPDAGVTLERLHAALFVVEGVRSITVSSGWQICDQDDKFMTVQHVEAAVRRIEEWSRCQRSAADVWDGRGD
jgi:hypothetical protein